MSFAFGAEDNAIVVVDEDPNTLLAVEGNVNVLPPVASCVIINVPQVPAVGVVEKFKVLF